MRDSNLVGDYPDQFCPKRFIWNESLIQEVGKTFGGGLTPCIGKQFAKTETLLLIAAMILQGPFELINGDPSEVILEAGAHLSRDLKIQISLKDD